MRIFSLITAFAICLPATVFAQTFADIPMPRGFKALDMPADFGGKPLAGALVQITTKRGFRYLGHLSDCGLPANAVQVLPSLGPDGQVSQTELEMDLSVAARIKGFFSAEIGANRASKVRITLGQVTDEMVIPIAVLSAAQTHGDTLEARCGMFLKQRNVFWINNALKADSLKIELLDERGGRISVSSDKVLAEDIRASAEMSVSQDGLITILRPVYVAFRDAPPSELLTGSLAAFSLSTGPRFTTASDGTVSMMQDIMQDAPTGLIYGDEVFAR